MGQHLKIFLRKNKVETHLGPEQNTWTKNRTMDILFCTQAKSQEEDSFFFFFPGQREDLLDV